ncbi:MAG: hypothetical protein WDW38_000196 [Sanguina aurantia]
MPRAVADLSQARGPAHAASKILCNLPPSSFPLTSVYTLPPGLKTSPLFSAVLTAAEESLLATFGNALNIITSPALLQQFNLLPQPAVLALLQSDQLMADTEASVLLLVDSWCTEVDDKDCSDDQETELVGSIRYSRLPSPYLTDLCDFLILPDLSGMQLKELWAFRSLNDEEAT